MVFQTHIITNGLDLYLVHSQGLSTCFVKTISIQILHEGNIVSPRDKAALDLLLWPHGCYFSTRDLAINGRAVNGRMSGRFRNKPFNLCVCLFLSVPPKHELDSGSDDNFS